MKMNRRVVYSLGIRIEYVDATWVAVCLAGRVADWLGDSISEVTDFLLALIRLFRADTSLFLLLDGVYADDAFLAIPLFTMSPLAIVIAMMVRQR